MRISSLSLPRLRFSSLSIAGRPDPHHGRGAANLRGLNVPHLFLSLNLVRGSSLPLSRSRFSSLPITAHPYPRLRLHQQHRALSLLPSQRLPSSLIAAASLPIAAASPSQKGTPIAAGTL
ncbi:hypothetical protein AAC387_Pa10g0448 [Persea americana]